MTKPMGKRESRRFILNYLADELESGILNTSEVLTDRFRGGLTEQQAAREEDAIESQRAGVIQTLRRLAGTEAGK